MLAKHSVISFWSREMVRLAERQAIVFQFQQIKLKRFVCQFDIPLEIFQTKYIYRQIYTPIQMQGQMHWSTF